MPMRMKREAVVAGLMVLLCGISLDVASIFERRNSSGTAFAKLEEPAGKYSGKKVLWVDSYHQGYEWSDGVEQGIRAGLRSTGVVLEVFRMDTKRNDSAEYGKTAGEAARDAVERFKPDVVIASDDNAQKYLVVPYLKDTGLPVVFCGVNWDASVYGYPCGNIAGMVEMHLVKETVEQLRAHARGDRIGLISSDIETARRAVVFFNKRFFDGKLKEYLVGGFDDFKKEFSRAQQEVDMLIFYNYAGMKDWDGETAERFLAQETKIPTGGIVDWMTPFVVFDLAVVAEEHGRFVAQTALKVLDGTRPLDIPVMENKEYNLTVNLKMAKAAGIVLPVSILKTARVTGKDAFDFGFDRSWIRRAKIEGKKVLWVDSYHQGYEWSDGIEKGIRDVLYGTGVDLKVFRMDTKHNDSEEFGKEAGLRARAMLQQFRPDVLIASDDNAQKYLVYPYLKGASLPVVFCGVNWDASMYGYPFENITGMVEVELVEELMSYLRRYARGDRVGYLAGDVETDRKIIDSYNRLFFGGRMKSYLVKTFDEFQKVFRQAQDEVDILIIYNYAGIIGWDTVEAEGFLSAETRIPTGSLAPFMSPYTVFTLAKLPEEQGNYAAQAALQILAGRKPAELEVVTNRESQLVVNLKMAKSAGIILPVSILRDARVIGQGALQGR